MKARSLGKYIEKLYEDDHYIVFEKPPGLLVIPTAKKEQNTLTVLVNQQYRSKEASWKLHPCHRLDRETSGVIIFAKGKRPQQDMMQLFKERAVKKKYVAFIHGLLPKEAGEFRSSVEGFDRKKFRTRRVSKPAVTRYKVVKVKEDYSIVEVEPVTGRTNQIRIHFSEAGHPLVGERKYAFARDYKFKFRRVALHAQSVEWKNPVTGKYVKVISELWEDMRDFLLSK